MIFDLVVIGSGSVGSAAAFYATKAGLKVLAIDSGNPPHDQASHHGETRLIRHAYGEGLQYVPMVLRAQQLWYELKQLGGKRIMHKCGLITPDDGKFIGNVIESARKYNLPLEILPSSAVMQRWPQINMPNDYIGVFEADSGYLKCETAISHYIRLAKKAGCVQLFNTCVTGVSRDGEIEKVHTVSGEHFGRKVLFSAGTWLTKILPELPVQPVRKVFSWHQSDDDYNECNHFPGFIVTLPNGDNYYGFPANENVLKIGKHNGGQSINSADERKPFGEFADDNTEVVEILGQFFPGVGACLFGKSCTYDLTADDDFIIDTQPGEPNRLIISGLSGHGFKFASVLGEIAATFAQGKSVSFDLTPFALARFKQNKA
ncbi:uncharacterized protein LOC116346742 isoform X2 [Contarinia nasturtii]|uniref:uncharacterized protein LOC116346742 isoform X2 n=1 Tax=Contarinia nasturtii TaxID=265458 RepID=UPI0012D3C1B2|nr:uncharacterized protein LOC116346742 isoform X2 [Contarinia nasturtii]